MEHYNDLTTLTNGITEKMRELRYSEGTISEYDRVYTQLIDFSTTLDDSTCLPELIECFRKKKSIDAQKFNPRYMEKYNIALNKLTDTVTGQDIQLNHRSFPVGPELVNYSWVLPEMEKRLKLRLSCQNDIKCRIHELRLFLAFLESKQIFALSECSIDHLAEAFNHSGCKSLYHCVISEFLKLAFEKKWIANDLSCFVPQARARKPAPVIYSAEELEQVLNSIDVSTVSGKRKYAIFLIMTRLGLRSSDVCELQFSNIDWAKKIIALIQKKTGIPITLPLLPEIEYAINAYIAVRPKSDLPYVFLRNRAPFLPVRNTTLVYELRVLFTKAGIYTRDKKCSPHVLRSSFASSLLRDGVSYPIVQKALGHNSHHAMKFYAQVDIERLRECALEVPAPSGKFANLIGEIINE